MAGPRRRAARGPFKRTFPLLYPSAWGKFTNALGATNVDEILDFAVADDTIHLLRSMFTRAGANGPLAASAFHQGSAAADPGHRILYDQATGKIFYDSDGTGAATAILFATVAAGTPLTYADFVIYG